MSGGSFDYASSARTLEDLTKRLEDLKEIAICLKEHAAGSKAASDTERLLLVIEELDDLIQLKTAKLGKVWHGLEWYMSCDWSKDQFLAEVEIYEQNN